MKRSWIILPLLALLLAACGKPACMRDQPYQHARQFPPLNAPAGLSVPPPDPNLAIPEVDDGPVSAVKDPDASNGHGIRCLDVPPRLPATADEPASGASDSD